MLDADFLEKRIPEIRDLKNLARGGQKYVFSGKHDQFGEIVIKVFLSFTEEERVIREIETTTKIKIPNTAKIFTWGKIELSNEILFYMIEEFIKGITLRQYLNKYKKLHIKQVIELMDKLLEIAVILEKNGMVHRDIKPENIMVLDNGEFILLDFGIVRHLNKTSITPTAARFGLFTPGYAPPEQFRNFKNEIDIRSDLFSIGIVAHECISGNNPFIVGARDDLEILHRTENKIPELLAISEDKTGLLSKFIPVLMAKYKSQRPQTAKQAKEWIEEIKGLIISNL